MAELIPGECTRSTTLEDYRDVCSKSVNVHVLLFHLTLCLYPVFVCLIRVGPTLAASANSACELRPATNRARLRSQRIRASCHALQRTRRGAACDSGDRDRARDVPCHPVRTINTQIYLNLDSRTLVPVTPPSTGESQAVISRVATYTRLCGCARTCTCECWWWPVIHSSKDYRLPQTDGIHALKQCAHLPILWFDQVVLMTIGEG
ncbi:hypothetical protein BJV78DRAFT_117024 [Lactifluus subvellereus]|nr:hypothetical protein BJV78DRAFT_117024 [Lactifluus subvellereus]